MLEGTIRFKVFCEKCKEQLSISADMRFPETQFLIAPCPHCLEIENSRGFKEGYDNGYEDGERYAECD